jgi:hypothetical protein
MVSPRGIHGVGTIADAGRSMHDERLCRRLPRSAIER